MTAALSGGAIGQSSSPPPDDSAQAYSDQSDAEALSTAHEEFEGLLDTPPLKWPPVHAGEDLRGYLSEDTAVVSEPSGALGLVESTIPLRGETPGGDTAPIDLGLVDVGDSAFAPKSAAAEVRIPDESTEPLRFPEVSVGVELEGAASQAASVQSNSAFYANVIEDGDLVLEPQPEGAELSVLLRSPAAPTEIPLRFELPAGAALRMAAGTGSEPLPSGAIEVVDGSRRLASVSPAVAVDADGRDVPVHYELDGRRVIMNVDPTGEVSWPVLVDPIIGVYDNNGTSVCPTGGCDPTKPKPTGWTWPDWKPATYAELPDTTTNTWSYCNNQGSNPNKKFYFCQGTLGGTNFDGGPLYVKANGSPTQSYLGSQWGAWTKKARVEPNGQSNAYIYQFDTTALSNEGEAHAQVAVGVQTAGGAWESGNVVWGNGSTSNGVAALAGKAAYETPLNTAISSATRYVYVHGGMPTPATPIAPGNVAVVMLDMAAGATGTPVPYAAVGGGATYSSETYPPAITAVTHTKAAPTGWVESHTDTVGASVVEHGLGMGTTKLNGPGVPTTGSWVTACWQNGAPSNVSLAKASNYYDNCTLTQTLPASSSTTYTTTQEGINSYNVTATDLVGNTDTEPWTVKIDKSPPAASLSGALYDDRTMFEQDGEGVATDVDDSGSIQTDESVTVTATDGVGPTGAASAKRSGIASIEMLVDGQRRHPEDRQDATCSATGCPFDGPPVKTFTLHPGDFSTSGDHKVTIVVRDQLASPTATTAGTHVWTETFDVYVDKDQTVAAQLSSSIGEDDPPAAIDPDDGLIPQLSLVQESDLTTFIGTEVNDATSDLNKVVGLSSYSIDSIAPRTGDDPVTGNDTLIGAFVILKLGAPRTVDAVVPALAGRPPDVIRYRAHFVGTGVTDLALYIDLPRGDAPIAAIQPGPDSVASTYAPEPGTPTLPPYEEDGD
ncbi:MAG TPA: hypothetical protein VJT75_14775 [Thermoleophilaceae bacterium]|nr:hypothetical protein [Thermoleophilaceae bacterium]